MGLTRALNSLRGDRTTESLAREILQVMTLEPRPSLTSARLSQRLPLHDRYEIDVVLKALVDGEVLDFDSGSGAFTYHKDTALDFEVRRFIRSAGGHGAHVRTNVDRFRQGYGRI